MSDAFLPEEAPSARRAPPEKRAPQPDWFYLLDRAGGRALGDWVTIGGIDGIGQVLEILSHRRAGGLVVTVSFPQGVWVRCGLRDVSPACFVDAESA